ncbi:protein phosphatase 1 regulatory subunit 3C [Nilaparvata lugens]|uniref:protein phosphatase 1 regulatory subunit 3C n=1 Tax=Nilaparvata lugens TaxID=108931 RepID=UPI000B987E39|nr:protein phosphatase 1 regulatory subunit 3C [Nilaparvata lugens]XP_039283280.1 protein phosphatase 1 regulatory subunit 3C [Nilaparvata lugens]
MCSLVMPADYDVMLAHSPPVFSHSPPSAFYATSCRRSPIAARRHCPPVVAASTTSQRRPQRPILVLRPDDSSSSDDNEPTSPTRHKKRVVFADDKGLSLTHVRMLTESPFMPPAWSSQFLMLVTRGVSAEVAPEPWEPAFAQPASDYLQFRRRLDEENVSLENVIVKELEEAVVGTVKVRNLAFEKTVFVRSSGDNWATSEDAFCTYMPSSTAQLGHGVKVLYDTFSFRLTLPPKSRAIEFCVCFRCELGEFWDNNNGRNYIVHKKRNNDATSAAKSPAARSEPVAVPGRNYSGSCGWSDFDPFYSSNDRVPYW